MNPIDTIIAVTLHSPDGDTFTAWATDDHHAVPVILTINPDGTFDIRQDTPE